KVTLSMDVGHRVVLDATGAGEVRIEHSNGTTIVLTSSGDVQINANARLEVNASLVEVHAPMARFDGVVQCETLVASTGVAVPPSRGARLRRAGPPGGGRAAPGSGWPAQGAPTPAPPPESRPAIQKYAGTDSVARSLAAPQASLAFEPEDHWQYLAALAPKPP